MGSFGLPVVNCKKSRRCVESSSLIVCSKFLTLRLSMLKPWSALIESKRAIKDQRFIHSEPMLHTKYLLSRLQSSSTLPKRVTNSSGVKALSAE